jgi:hypothetical protein
LLYDKLQRPPTPGSLKEVVCLLVQRYRQKQELYRLVAELAPPENRQAAVRQYQDALAPHLARARDEQTMQMHQMFSDMMRVGPLAVVPEEKDGKK